MPTLAPPRFTSPRFDPRVLNLLQGYPPGLFTEKLHSSIELMHRYTLELATDLLQRLGLTASLENWRTADELCGLSSFDPKFCTVLRWLMDEAVELGYLESKIPSERRSYRVIDASWVADLATLREIALGIDPANAPTLDLLDHAASIYPAVARGEASADTALFDVQSIALWLAYFHNDNPTYAVNNWTAAVAAVERLAGRRQVRILEVGAGAGSGTEILLCLLRERGLVPALERYVITELSPFFLRRAQRELSRRYAGLPLEFRPLDIDRAWATQAVSAGEFDLVYGINVLHVAHDLTYSLSEACSTLADKGWLVLGECLQSDRHKPIFPELIFQILDSFREVQTDPDFRPCAGFLTPNQWQRALASGGFAVQEVQPDVEAISEFCPNFLAGAVCAQKTS